MNKLGWIVIAILTAYTCFMGGRTFEAHQYVPVREQEQKDLLKKKIKKHGSGYYYIEQRGKLFLVKNPRDLENRKKWIRL